MHNHNNFTNNSIGKYDLHAKKESPNKINDAVNDNEKLSELLKDFEIIGKSQIGGYGATIYIKGDSRKVTEIITIDKAELSYTIIDMVGNWNRKKIVDLLSEQIEKTEI